MRSNSERNAENLRLLIHLQCEGGGGAEVNKRRPNVFCGMRAPQLVIRNKKLTLSRLFLRKKDHIDLC